MNINKELYKTYTYLYVENNSKFNKLEKIKKYRLIEVEKEGKEKRVIQYSKNHDGFALLTGSASIIISLGALVGAFKESLKLSNFSAISYYMFILIMVLILVITIYFNNKKSNKKINELNDEIENLNLKLIVLKQLLIEEDNFTL